jgi:hypothetical protein
MQKAEDIQAHAVDFNPDDVVPEEVQQKLREVLIWHDDILRDITRTIQNIPGLEKLFEEFSNAMTACEYLLSMARSCLSHFYLR